MVKMAKKQSKRQPARQRYKIEKKIRQHNKKTRRDAKKHPKNKKKNVIQVPNICPFKEDILKEVEAMKKQKEEEKQKLKEAARLEKQKQKQDQKKVQASNGLEGLVSNAENREKLHNAFNPESDDKIENKKKDNSKKL